MKTMTCKELGGLCDKKLSAKTQEKVIEKMLVHVVDTHPALAQEMKKMYD